MDSDQAKELVQDDSTVVDVIDSPPDADGGVDVLPDDLPKAVRRQKKSAQLRLARAAKKEKKEERQNLLTDLHSKVNQLVGLVGFTNEKVESVANDLNQRVRSQPPQPEPVVVTKLHEKRYAETEQPQGPTFKQTLMKAGGLAVLSVGSWYLQTKLNAPKKPTETTTTPEPAVSKKRKRGEDPHGTDTSTQDHKNTQKTPSKRQDKTTFIRPKPQKPTSIFKMYNSFDDAQPLQPVGDSGFVV